MPEIIFETQYINRCAQLLTLKSKGYRLEAIVPMKLGIKCMYLHGLFICFERLCIFIFGLYRRYTNRIIINL